MICGNVLLKHGAVRCREPEQDTRQRIDGPDCVQACRVLVFNGCRITVRVNDGCRLAEAEERAQLVAAFILGRSHHRLRQHGRAVG